VGWMRSTGLGKVLYVESKDVYLRFHSQDVKLVCVYVFLDEGLESWRWGWLGDV